MAAVVGQTRKKLRKQKKPSVSSFFVEEIFFGSWWIVAFLLLCHIGYDLGLQHWHHEYSNLSQRLLRLEEEKKSVQTLQEDLRYQVYSQSDHAWVELTLMKGLGLVPEGQVKVFFKD